MSLSSASTCGVFDDLSRAGWLQVLYLHIGDTFSSIFVLKSNSQGLSICWIRHWPIHAACQPAMLMNSSWRRELFDDGEPASCWPLLLGLVHTHVQPTTIRGKRKNMRRSFGSLTGLGNLLRAANLEKLLPGVLLSIVTRKNESPQSSPEPEALLVGLNIRPWRHIQHLAPLIKRKQASISTTL